VTHNHACLFGEIVDGKVRLSSAGQIAQNEWQLLEQRFPNIQLGEFIVMPNHVHGIIIINAGVGATHPIQTGYTAGKDNVPGVSLSGITGSPLPDGDEQTPRRPNGPAPGSLGAIIGQFKSQVTKRLWAGIGLSGTPIWQRNYYEHVVRSDDEHHRTHLHIESNPANWLNDEENPEKPR
jgi:REP element-mobilizing transposase RayT